MLNLETVGWYFDGLNMQVLYRETPQGLEVLAVGYDEVVAFKDRVPFDERKTPSRASSWAIPTSGPARTLHSARFRAISFSRWPFWRSFASPWKKI